MPDMTKVFFEVPDQAASLEDAADKLMKKIQNVHENVLFTSQKALDFGRVGHSDDAGSWATDAAYANVRLQTVIEVWELLTGKQWSIDMIDN